MLNCLIYYMMRIINNMEGRKLKAEKVIIKNNGRISSKESKEFTTFEDSQNYMNEFIKESLL